MTERPDGLDDLLGHVEEIIGPVTAIRHLHTTMSDEDFAVLTFRGDTVRELLARLDRFERMMPSWRHGKPVEYDAWLRELIPDDKRLEFYQWVSSLAVGEAFDSIRNVLSIDPVPVEHRSYSPDDVHEFLDYFDPLKDGDPFPSKLPIGRPFCNLPEHDHTDGGGRLPTCRIEPEE